MPHAMATASLLSVDGLALALDGQHAVNAPVSLNDIGLDGQMGLMLGMEAALGDKGGFLEHLGGVSALEDGLLHIEVGQALVELDGVGHHSLGEGHVSGQDLQILLDLLGGSAGMLLGVGRDQSHDIAASADLFAGDDGELRDAFALLARNDGGDAILLVPLTSLAVMTL